MSKRIDTAYHEAAHAVVQYRASGSASGSASIIPQPSVDGTRTLGQVTDYITDSSSEKDCRARVLSCYAGAAIDQKRGCFNSDSCASDDIAAAEVLGLWGWEGQEQSFRNESARLVDLYSPAIEAVAIALLKREQLDMTEIEIIADIAENVDSATLEDLAMYRELAYAGLRN